MTCNECQHLDLAAAEAIAKGYARLGLGKCKVLSLHRATFITAAAARDCESFEAAPGEVVAKRVEWMKVKV